MVTSVQMVPIAPRSKREREDESEYVSRIQKEHIAFNDVLNEVMEDEHNFNFKNTTYNSNSLMSTFLFMTHAYN